MPIKKSTATKKKKSPGVPVSNKEQSNESVELMAYQIWEQRGRIPGTDLENWLEAEKIFKEKFNSN